MAAATTATKRRQSGRRRREYIRTRATAWQSGEVSGSEVSDSEVSGSYRGGEKERVNRMRALAHLLDDGARLRTRLGRALAP